MDMLEQIVSWAGNNPFLRWAVATFLTLIYFIDDKPYHLIVVWAVIMLADLFSRMWRLAYENGGFIAAIKAGKLCSARLIQGVGDELMQVFIWSAIAWAITIPVPDNASFTFGTQVVVIDNLIRSMPFAYLAIGDLISIAENFIGSDKGSKKQQFYHWILETFVMLANALRMRIVNIIGGGYMMGGGYPMIPQGFDVPEIGGTTPPMIPEMHDSAPSSGTRIDPSLLGHEPPEVQ